MITNFDSTEQRREWERIVDDKGVQFSWEQLWFRDSAVHQCERLLNEETTFATHFAGTIRTAYLYCPRIMLTDAQLFDGVFFLALGPHAVNEILGKSYKDGPAIIVSGRKNTLEECLVNFTVRCIADIKKASTEDLPCAGEDSQYALRPLEYSALGGKNMQESQSLGMSDDFYASFTNRLNRASKRGSDESKAQVIAEALACTWYGSEQSQHKLAFLAQRWQEWIDAEREGLILYENQNDEIAKQRSQGTFGELFQRYSKEYGDVLRQSAHLESTERSDDVPPDNTVQRRECCARALDDLMTLPKRSDAFLRIDSTDLPEAGNGSGASGSCSKQMLRDWYQFVYQQSLAGLLGANLVSVDAKENSFAQLAGNHSGSAALMLSGNITRILGEMPFVRFVTFCYDSRSTIRAWRECSPKDSPRKQRIVTRNMAYSVEQAGQEKSLSDDRRSMLWGAVVAMVLAFISAMTDNVWLNGNAPIWLIVAAAWVISIVPDLIDMVSWLREVRSSSKTVVYLQ